MVDLYHIYLRPKASINLDAVKEKMNLALDWYMYADHCWVVKTTSDSAKWQARLKSLVEPEGSLLIFKIEPLTRQGWMPKSFWDWLKSDKKSDDPA